MHFKFHLVYGNQRKIWFNNNLTVIVILKVAYVTNLSGHQDHLVTIFMYFYTLS